jgi:phage gp45-like
MHRATPANTLYRSYDAGGSRSTIASVDDTPLMQTMAGNFMKGESRKAVEAPQNYGFTSVVRDATKSQDGQLNECAEGFMTFIGGNRSFPVCTVMDDRRYRLKALEKGDVAMFDYLQHQLHFNTNGMFLTGRTDKKVKIQLADPPQDQQQSGGSSGGALSGYTALASSGDSSGGSSQSGGQKSLKGQTKRYDKTSKQYLEMTKDSHNLVHDQTINYKTGVHSFQPPDSSTTARDAAPRDASGMLVQIFGNKFTGGLGYFMKQVTAAPPTSPFHVVTKNHLESVLTALGITIPTIPPLPMPPLPPGIVWPPDVPMPSADKPIAAARPAQDAPRFVIDGGTF